MRRDLTGSLSAAAAAATAATPQTTSHPSRTQENPAFWNQDSQSSRHHQDGAAQLEVSQELYHLLVR